jgi:wyosine [tRNA(Phe)-imidazoG37] synthetase (radical SAM superfamily)
VGLTSDKETARRSFHEPGHILKSVVEHLSQVDTPVDYFSFVPDGEPTLDINLGRSIKRLRTLGIPIAVITNASLLWQPSVQEDLMEADWVSLKIDTVEEGVWKRLNRPDPHLEFSTVRHGMETFARDFTGELVTETMLVEGVNDEPAHFHHVADFIATLDPRKAYLSIPTRPPAVNWVRAADEATVNRAYNVFKQSIDRVECLTGFEGDTFATTGDFEQDLLSITAVHPLREDTVHTICKRDGANWAQLEALVQKGMLARIPYEGDTYFLRKWRK